MSVCSQRGNLLDILKVTGTVDSNKAAVPADPKSFGKDVNGAPLEES